MLSLFVCNIIGRIGQAANNIDEMDERQTANLLPGNSSTLFLDQQGPT
jgi:hypothetical protein